jgi:hypothetical protein
MARSAKAANFADYDGALFELYTRCRYNELICHELMRGAARLERANQASLFGSISVALFAGTLGFMNTAGFVWVWAVFGVLATLLSLYSLIVDSGGRRFAWFGIATKLRALADEVEQFSLYVRRKKITEQELRTQWRTFGKALAELIEQGGVGLREYEAKRRDALRNELAIQLRQENRAAGRSNARQTPPVVTAIRRPYISKKGKS